MSANVDAFTSILHVSRQSANVKCIVWIKISLTYKAKSINGSLQNTESQ